jgi:hypothetical protein
MRVVTHDFRDMPVGGTAWRIFVIQLPSQQVQEDQSASLFELGEIGSAVQVEDLEDEHAIEIEETRTGAENESIAEAAKPRERFSVDVFLNASYMPLLPIYGLDPEEFSDVTSFIGGSFRAGFLNSKEIGSIHLGFEIELTWFSLEILQEGQTLAAQMMPAALGLHFLVQKRHPNQIFANNFRLGTGNVYGIPFVNIGISFLLTPINVLYVEAGIDYAHLFFIEPNMAFIRPWIGIGARF